MPKSEELIDAVKRGDFTAALALVKQGADVNAKMSNGTTALMLACFGGHTEIAKSLLDKGADVNVKTGDGYTALIAASGEGNLEIALALLDKGADANAKLDDGRTALIEAAHKGNLKIVSALLDNGADPNAKPSDGCTALVQASEAWQSDIVAELFARGADSARMRDFPARNLNTPPTAKDFSSRTGIVLLYKERADGISDFARIQDYLGTSRSAVDWRGQVLLVSNNWRPQHNNAHDLTFKYSIVWTARDVEYGERWKSVGSPLWSSIISGTLAYDLVVQSIAKNLNPPLGVDSITECDDRTVSALCDAKTATPLILGKYDRRS